MSTYNPSSGEMEIGGFLGLTDRPVYLACLVNCRVMTAPVSIGRRHSKSGISSHQNTYSTHYDLHKHEHADKNTRELKSIIYQIVQRSNTEQQKEWKIHLNLLKGWAQNSNLSISQPVFFVEIS